MAVTKAKRAAPNMGNGGPSGQSSRLLDNMTVGSHRCKYERGPFNGAVFPDFFGMMSNRQIRVSSFAPPGPPVRQ